MRYVVFGRGRVTDGLVDLRCHAWEADRFGERVTIPYRVRISLEGLPHHAWSQEMAQRVLGDEAVIHHVEQVSRRREDYTYFACWAFSQHPSRIPQTVYLTLTDSQAHPGPDAQLHFSRPRNVQWGQVFRVLVHIDSVENLLYYHHPPEQLSGEGKTQLRELRWCPGRPDGDMDDEEDEPVQRYCRPDFELRPRPRRG
jgi:hypothetical protein